MREARLAARGVMAALWHAAVAPHVGWDGGIGVGAAGGVSVGIGVGVGGVRRAALLVPFKLRAQPCRITSLTCAKAQAEGTRSGGSQPPRGTAPYRQTKAWRPPPGVNSEAMLGEP